MGNSFVGIVHPCKLYNILTIGSPFLYIGPKESHIAEIAAQTSRRLRAYAATNGDVEKVVASILKETQRPPNGERGGVPEIAASFSREVLLPRMVKLLECRSELDSQVSGPSETANYMSATR
jgi:hypothetical protein